MAVALVLIAGKLFVWLLTGSLSVMASLVDSLMDAAASTINMVAVRWSLVPADAEHRHGHGKAESLAGLAQASFIAGSAFFLVVHAVERFANPVPITGSRTGVLVMTGAIALTLALLLFQHHVIRKTGSTAIRADALHYGTDVLTNLGTIIALVLAGYGFPLLDPVIAIVIACYIFYSAWKIGMDAVHMLMDRELPPEVRERIREIAQAPAQVKGVHDIRTRRSGQTIIIQLHLELDDDIPLVRAHGVGKAVEKEILRAWPEADVIIHQDPVHLLRKTGQAVDRN
ncbi:MAG: CDF family cation-efflux transporter FieF [Desulfobulbaceae bacterium]